MWHSFRVGETESHGGVFQHGCVLVSYSLINTKVTLLLRMIGKLSAVKLNTKSSK